MLHGHSAHSFLIVDLILTLIVFAVLMVAFHHPSESDDPDDRMLKATSDDGTHFSVTNLPTDPHEADLKRSMRNAGAPQNSDEFEAENPWVSEVSE